MDGVNKSVVIAAELFISQTPMADPAAIAAPNAVVSGIDGLTERIDNMVNHIY